MSKKAVKRSVADQDIDDWFLLQCFARNGDFLRLCERYGELSEDYYRPRSRRRRPNAIEKEVVALLRSEFDVLADPEVLGFMVQQHDLPEQTLRLLEYSLRDSSHPAPTKKTIQSWIGYVRRQNRSDRLRRRIERGWEEVQDECVRRFGIAYPHDPRPFKNDHPGRLGWVAEMYEGGLSLVRSLRPVKCDTDPYRPGRWRGARVKPRETPSEWVQRFISDGSILTLALDLRWPAGVLEAKFHALLQVVESMKRKGTVPAFGRKKPHRDLDFLKDHFAVWDLTQRGWKPGTIAMRVFEMDYSRDEAGRRNAATKVVQYRNRVEEWISLAWRSAEKGTPTS